MAFKRVLVTGSDDVSANKAGPGMIGLAHNPAISNIATVGAGTLTAGALGSGIIQRTGPTGAYSDATDTAANILAGPMAGANVGDSITCIISNQVAYAQTITAGTGVTLVTNANAIVEASTFTIVVITKLSDTTVRFMML